MLKKTTNKIVLQSWRNLLNDKNRRNNWRVKRGKRARGDKETTASIGSSGVGQKKKDGSMELELAERCIYNRALAQGNTTLGIQDPSHDV
jgi:hypothetical protein